MGILRRFHYIDDEQLNQYISQVEDGLRSAASRSGSRESAVGAKINVKIAELEGRGGRNASTSAQYEDTSASRFDRLLGLVEGVEEEFGWIELDPEGDSSEGFQSLKTGHILSCAAELYESDVTAISGKSGLLAQLPLIEMISKLSGSSSPFGDVGSETMAGIGAFGQAMEGNSVLLGDVPEFDFTLVASIPDSIKVENYAYVVGKVIKTWPKGSWRPLPNLPIISQMPRQQRREYERNGPGATDKMMWVEGPGVHLDLLAIYQ